MGKSKDEWIAYFKSEIARITAILETFKKKESPHMNSDKIYNEAFRLLNTDASPNDVAPDGLACAETVWNIVNRSTGYKIGGGLKISTTTLYESLLNSPSFESVTLDNAIPGDIVISPTGYGGKKEWHGHTGIVGKFHIMSNNPEDGRLDDNFTKHSWKLYFEGRDFPICCFHMKD